MATLTTTNGIDFTVSEESLVWAKRLKWGADKRKSGTVYIYTSIGGKKIYLHRLVFAMNGSGVCVDHINRDSTDNCLENLRVATNSGNSTNVLKKRVSGYRGVNKHKNKWVAVINKDYKVHRSYSHSTEESAARAYDRMAIELHGEFAILNFPLEKSA